MANVLEYVIAARDMASAAFEKFRGNVDKSLSGAGSKVKQFGSEVSDGLASRIKGALGPMAIFAAAGYQIKKTFDYAEQIKDAADATGLATESFQVLSRVASANGVSVGNFTQAMMRLSNIMGDIGNNPAAQMAFAKLGIRMDEVKNKSPEEILQRIARGFNEVGDRSAIFDLFGRSAGRLIGTLNELNSSSLPELRKNMSGIISDDDIQRMDAAKDSLENIGKVATGYGAIGGNFVAQTVKYMYALAGSISSVSTLMDGVNPFSTAREVTFGKENEKLLKTPEELAAERAAKANADKLKDEVENGKKREEEAKKLADKLVELRQKQADAEAAIAQQQMDDEIAMFKDAAEKAKAAADGKAEQLRKPMSQQIADERAQAKEERTQAQIDKDIRKAEKRYAELTQQQGMSDADARRMLGRRGRALLDLADDRMNANNAAANAAAREQQELDRRHNEQLRKLDNIKEEIAKLNLGAT